MVDKPAKESKRRVKNPESFRERAAKANESNSQPKASSLVKQGVGNAYGQSFGRFFAALGRLAQYQPFKAVAVVLRFVGKIVFPTYFRNSYKELKQVEWPNWAESRRLTSAVLIFAIVFGAAIAIVDYGLDKVFRQLLLK